MRNLTPEKKVENKANKEAVIDNTIDTLTTDTPNEPQTNHQEKPMIPGLPETDRLKVKKKQKKKNKDFYNRKVSFPYVRQVGVNGKVKRFEHGQESEFLDYLRTTEASYLWSDSEDLQVMANLYQMKINVISIKDDSDENPSVNFIGPDPELSGFRLLPAGKVPDMTLLHYGQQHYNLIVSKDSDLVKKGTLTDQLKNPVKVSVEDITNSPDDNDEDSDVSQQTDNEEEISFKEKYERLEKEYRKGQNLIKSLRKKISLLEEKVVSKEEEKVEEKDEALNEKEILSNKHSGYKRESPQFESNHKKSTLEFKCEKCKEGFDSQLILNTHLKDHDRDGGVTCSVCAAKFEHKNTLQMHMTKKHREGPVKQFN